MHSFLLFKTDVVALAHWLRWSGASSRCARARLSPGQGTCMADCQCSSPPSLSLSKTQSIKIKLKRHMHSARSPLLLGTHLAKTNLLAPPQAWVPPRAQSPKVHLQGPSSCESTGVLVITFSLNVLLGAKSHRHEELPRPGPAEVTRPDTLQEDRTPKRSAQLCLHPSFAGDTLGQRGTEAPGRMVRGCGFSQLALNP